MSTFTAFAVRCFVFFFWVFPLFILDKANGMGPRGTIKLRTIDVQEGNPSAQRGWWLNGVVFAQFLPA